MIAANAAVKAASRRATELPHCFDVLLLAVRDDDPGGAALPARPPAYDLRQASRASCLPAVQRGFAGAICRTAQSTTTENSANATIALLSSQVGSLKPGNGPIDGTGK
ncbi:MAG: hypothetical protein QOI54_3059 [Actinomycetota bacterium]|nr:hypothetical protein [Actinomycetota bacterium]